MKKLQINYTNIFQSERLLKMGVPAWSADCTQEKDIGGSIWQHKWIKNEWDEYYDAKDYQKFLDREKDTLPCWSACRLIEIYMIATGSQWIDLCFPDDFTESIIKMFEGTKDLDFSKLEE